MSTETGQPEKKGWFARLRDGLSKSSRRLVDGITGLFVKRRLDAATLEELEDLLITADRSEEHTSELQSLMRISYAVFCSKKKTTTCNRSSTTNLQILTKII